VSAPELPFPPLVLGRRCDDDRPVTVPADELVRHLAVFGTTGSGKTSLFLALLCQLMDRGRGWIFCTTKHDPTMPRALAWAALQRQQMWRLRVFDPGHPVHNYNPTSTSNPVRLAKLYHSQLPRIEPGSEAQHYHNLAFEFLLVACRAVIATGLRHVPDDLLHLASNYDIARDYLAARLRAVGRQDLMADLDGFFRRFWQHNEFQVHRAREALSGLTAVLTTLQAGRTTGPLNDPGSAVDLLQACRRGLWVYLGLPRAQDADGGQFGRLFLTDLIETIDEIQATEGALAHAPFVIILDEFPSYAVPEFATVFEQARSAGIALIMGAQTVSGLSDRAAGLSEGFRDRVLGNCAHLVSFRIGPGEGAEYLSQYVGKADRRLEQMSQTASAGREWNPLSLWAWLGISREHLQRAAFVGYQTRKDSLLESRVLTHEIASRGEAVWLSSRQDDSLPFRFRTAWAATDEAPHQWDYRRRCPQWSWTPPPMLDLGRRVRERTLSQTAGAGAQAAAPPAPAGQGIPGAGAPEASTPSPGADGAARRRRRGQPRSVVFAPPLATPPRPPASPGA
jgi:hypothetical protein